MDDQAFALRRNHRHTLLRNVHCAICFKASTPHPSSILIYHTTKAGNFRGENAYTHEVDVIVQVAAGEITANGRFANRGR
jgi:hypothetical protein